MGEKYSFILRSQVSKQRLRKVKNPCFKALIREVPGCQECVSWAETSSMSIRAPSQPRMCHVEDPLTWGLLSLLTHSEFSKNKILVSSHQWVLLAPMCTCVWGREESTCGRHLVFLSALRYPFPLSSNIWKRSSGQANSTPLRIGGHLTLLIRAFNLATVIASRADTKSKLN